MTAQQLLALADWLRSYARQSGHDVNASNMFVHTMLMRTMAAEGTADKIDVSHEPGELLDG